MYLGAIRILAHHLVKMYLVQWLLLQSRMTNLLMRFVTMKKEFEYHLDAAALLQMCSPYASIAAISRVSGINQHQLSHYANGIKKPRPEQRRRIVEGLHRIGRELISIK